MVEQKLPPSWSGSVVLDIGGDIGALMIRTTSEMNGHEIDLVGDDELIATHSEVRPRLLGNETSFAAVYPGLREGMYTVAVTGQRIVIVGGRVTDVEYGDIEAYGLPGEADPNDGSSKSSPVQSSPVQVDRSSHHNHVHTREVE